MKYLLDTDTCIYWLKGNEHIEKKALKVGLARIFISFITLSELYYGAYKSRKVVGGRGLNLPLLSPELQGKPL